MVLTKVQQALEKQLFQQRLELLNKQRVQKQELVAKKGSLVELTALDAKIKEERMQKDMSLASQLDQTQIMGSWST